MLLSDRDIRREIDNGRVGLDPWDPSMVQPSSVDVRLGRGRWRFTGVAVDRYTTLVLDEEHRAGS